MTTEKCLQPKEVDELLQLPNGRAARLARAGKIPCIILPDGTIRFPSNIIEILRADPFKTEAAK